jgi:hypothetical protein
MAQRIQVLLTCDVCNDDTPGTTTERFGLGNSSYEADLCDRHGTQLRDSMAPFIGAGRRAGAAGGGTRRRGRSGGGTGDRARVQEIRAWAKSQGLKISERGRISADIQEQYEAANS